MLYLRKTRMRLALKLFRGEPCYDLSTTQYLSDLGYLHRELCRTANEIYEVVCGIPISYRKGEVI